MALALASCAAGGGRALDTGAPDATGPCASGTRCGAVCVDVARDPEHCGGCGRTCVVPHAWPACEEGGCAIGACEPGWLDCDGDPDDGCERAADCTEGARCTTSCGTTGTRSCADACAPACTPPPEVCNLVDDDCDGACEAGLPGCRVAVHRSYGSSGHFYTTSRAEAACCGMTPEAYDFFHLSSIGIDGTQPLFRCLATGGYHLYTTDTGCEMAAYEGQMGFIARTPACGAVPLFRLRHPGGDHFYTHSAPERDHAVSIGYADLGVIGYVWLTP
jgi:hypothetical protein